jgi:hypothetical protein
MVAKNEAVELSEATAYLFECNEVTWNMFVVFTAHPVKRKFVFESGQETNKNTSASLDPECCLVAWQVSTYLHVSLTANERLFKAENVQLNEWIGNWEVVASFRKILLVLKESRFQIAVYNNRIDAVAIAANLFRVFWDVLLSSQVDDRRFRGAYCLRCPDVGGSTHRWNVDQHLLDYTAVHPRRL